MCAYVHIYMCICVSASVSLYVHTWVCMGVYMCMHVLQCMCAFVHVCACKLTCVLCRVTGILFSHQGWTQKKAASLGPTRVTSTPVEGPRPGPPPHHLQPGLQMSEVRAPPSGCQYHSLPAGWGPGTVICLLLGLGLLLSHRAQSHLGTLGRVHWSVSSKEVKEVRPRGFIAEMTPLARVHGCTPN